jgi:hypothetical protein
MSEERTAAGAARRVGSGTVRVVRAWRALPHESRLAAFASLALFLTLFFPWYQVTLIAPAKTSQLQSASASITGWGAFSFVEAAVLLVAVGVLTLLFQRAEGRAFHLPGGDGGVIMAAGIWTCVLIVWRIFDKQGATTSGPSATSSGVEWGIFVGLAAAGFLAYSGSRIRAAHRPEPPLPGETGAPAGSNAAATIADPPRRTAQEREASRRARRPEGAPWSDEAPDSARDAPARRRRREPAPDSEAEAPARRRRPEPAPDSEAEAPARGRRREPAPDSPPDAPTARPRRPEAAPDAPSDAPPRPRRRPSAADLFERVEPDDPPTMPFGRAKPSDRGTYWDQDETGKMESRPARTPATDPGSADDQLTIPLPGDRNDTVPKGRDETVAMGRDDTLPMDQDDTVGIGRDETVSMGRDETVPLGEDDTRPLDDRRRRR